MLSPMMPQGLDYHGPPLHGACNVSVCPVEPEGSRSTTASTHRHQRATRGKGDGKTFDPGTLHVAALAIMPTCTLARYGPNILARNYRCSVRTGVRWNSISGVSAG